MKQEVFIDTTLQRILREWGGLLVELKVEPEKRRKDVQVLGDKSR